MYTCVTCVHVCLEYYLIKFQTWPVVRFNHIRPLEKLPLMKEGFHSWQGVICSVCACLSRILSY